MNDLVATRSSRTAGSAPPAARRGFERGTVLVVDDDPALLALIAEGLTHAGFDVIKATDGIDALSSMYATLPDAILVDLAMPRMSGVELIAQVCSESSFQDVTVVAMSGDEGMLQRATEAGAGAAMVKPLSIPGLVTALLRHTRRSATFSF